ncbi:alpha/beta fold hydrolase [Paraphotobacterium marinum]|uniref:alpha/beta fold hydrolase n=1 Tax=Paraphotobacterium marinum TaxID=1755811 RepID=UPI001CEF7818|nr:alpha/beta fold hydrolase [Paraphotobacterium marinum]
MNNVRYKSEIIDGCNIFYRESGKPANKTIVLLHGNPSSSYMYRDILSELGDEYYLVAPDYPGFGESDSPDPEQYDYTFDNIADTIEKLLIKKSINKYTLMIHDFGAPIGFKIAIKNPEKIDGFITMNGNAYEEGLHEKTWASLRDYWKGRSSELDKKFMIDPLSSLSGVGYMGHVIQNLFRLIPGSWIYIITHVNGSQIFVRACILIIKIM